MARQEIDAEDETMARQEIDEESEPDTHSYVYEAETDSEATADDRVLDEIPHQPTNTPSYVYEAETDSEATAEIPHPPTNILATDAVTSKTSRAEAVEEDVVLEHNQLCFAREERGHLLLAYFAAPSTGKKEEALLQLCDSWNVSVQFDIRRSGWIVFTFENEGESKLILKGSPYFVKGVPVVMKPMPSCFGFDDQAVKYAALWIQLPGLPLDCWSVPALSKIASKIGTPLCTDMPTRTKGRVSFPRVLVEVDASKELVRSIPIMLPVGKTRVQSVVFEHDTTIVVGEERQG